MQLNDDAFEQAKSLIRAGKVNKDSDWTTAKPTSTDAQEILQVVEWDDYSKWFFVIDPDADKQSQARYQLPYGDFEQVHRSALIASKSYANDNDHNDLEREIDRLIILIDKEPDAIDEASDESFPASDPPNWRDRR